ncbi:MAG: acyl--CoA ligase [Acidobacteriia bacterium]|nr:acyl--CoA ligase [Terriglobia bacterium]
MRFPLVHDMLARAAQARPDAPLVLDGRDRSTYAEAERASNRVARALVAEGIHRGDRVGLIADNSRWYVEAYYGILKAGGVVVSLSTAGDSRTHRALLADCGARGVVCGPTQARAVAGIAGLHGIEFVLGPAPPDSAEPAGLGVCRILEPSVVLSAMSDQAPPVRGIDLDRAAIVYTSGSTGRPRGAILRHLNIVANTRSIVQYLGLTPADRGMVVLPFHYVYGKSLLNTHVAAGGSVVIENRFMYPQQALDTLERSEATGLAGVPSTFAILLNKSNLASRRLPSLRYVTQAGGAMAPELTRRLIEALPGKEIYIMYGATEASARLSYLEPADLPRKIGSIGKAIPNVELRVLRDDGAEVEIGEIGEIVARGSNIMEGYWNAPEETAAVLDENGYHTGDLGRRDEEGFLYVVGRKREMIKSGAHRISPKEIEEVLVEHPAVHEAAVVGVPDEILGESIAAFVTLRPGHPQDGAGILAWCRERLPAYKIPTTLRSLREFPRNASGKIDKLALKRPALADAP